MAFYGKLYTLVGHENFDGWLKSVGLSDDKIKAIIDEKAQQKIVKDGDSYTLTSSSSKGSKTITFKSGVEFDDTFGDDKVPIKNTFIVDGNIVTQHIKSALGSATFKGEYNGDDLVVTITGDTFNGVAKRFFKA